ncbi:alpha/beta hydrolase [Rhizobium sp. AQ_MP]|uniref:alpha/beta fold hydrolase n=1 Tax=Rhizobium sp. AQ_MP TaxID=2761536 RepID=UPI00163B2117|nr:alpha/beta hydrolase [Rhizobium sp. AQ_MP]MBC2772606.1 alpha/beta hydrolase [Rhizobium sp. AQ_MP]
MTLSPPPAEWIGTDHLERDFVLIHGMVMAPSFWRTYAPDMVRRSHSAAYALPGHHPWKLAAPGQAITPEAVAAAYAAAIRRDFGGRPVTLIGHSTGGFVSLLIAHHYPELVKSIVLLGAFACGRFEGQERLPAKLLRVPRVGPFLFRQFFLRWIATSEQFRWGSIECVFDKGCPWQNDRAVAALEDVRLQLQQARPEDIAACIRFMSATSLLDHLRDIRIPVLNVIGADDAIVPSAHQLRVSKLLPQAQTVLLRNCGHLPMVEHQKLTASIISAFVDSMPIAQEKQRHEVLAPAGHATAHLLQLMSNSFRRTEQSVAGRVPTAHDTAFHPGSGEGPNEYHPHRHSNSTADRCAAELGL